MDDSENGIIIGKGFTDILIEQKVNKKIYPSTQQLWYTVKIQCKDGRYKFEIYDLYFKTPTSQLGPSMEIPAEGTFDIYYNDKVIDSYKKSKFDDERIKEVIGLHEKYISDIITKLNGLINSIKIAMSNKKNEDW